MFPKNTLKDASQKANTFAYFLFLAATSALMLFLGFIQNSKQSTHRHS